MKKNKKIIQNISNFVLEQIFEKKQFIEFKNEMIRFSEFLHNTNIEKIIVDITISEKEKQNFIKELLQDFESDNIELLNLINYILEQNLLNFFNNNNLLLILDNIEHDYKNLSEITISIAIKLKNSDIIDLKKQLEKKFNQKLLLNLKVNKSLIGGFIIEKGTKIIDASLSSALENYRKKWSDNILSS